MSLGRKFRLPMKYIIKFSNYKQENFHSLVIGHWEQKNDRTQESSDQGQITQAENQMARKISSRVMIFSRILFIITKGKRVTVCDKIYDPIIFLSFIIITSNELTRIVLPICLPEFYNFTSPLALSPIKYFWCYNC